MTWERVRVHAVGLQILDGFFLAVGDARVIGTWRGALHHADQEMPVGSPPMVRRSRRYAVGVQPANSAKSRTKCDWS